MKQLRITFLLSLLLSMVGVKALAYDVEVANEDGVTIYYNWTNDHTELSVTHKGYYSGDVMIPESVTYDGNSYPVTSIGGYAFYNCGSLTSVAIPSSVTSISQNAFSGCSGLTSVTIPSSVTTIGTSAFSGCSGLNSVAIPSSVTAIGESAFGGCSGLTSITVNEGNSNYDSRNNCKAIIETATNKMIAGCKNTAISNTVTSIGSSAFSGCSGLTSVTIPSSVTSIGNYAFSNCSGLTSVNIPSSVTNIGWSAFAGCCGLTSITVDGGNSNYDSRNNCKAIIETATNKLIAGCKNTIIPNTVTSIGNSAFSGCSDLTSVTIPSSVTSIGQFALSGCSGLTSVTVPSSVTSIGGGAFQGCGCLTSVTIPSSVTSIGFSAFQGCSGLTSVAIPSSVTSIDISTFSGCSGLTSVTIPSSVTNIGSYAFGGCRGLTSVTIPSSVTSINDFAFDGCSGLTSVTISEGVTSIGFGAFQGCSGLTSVTIPSSVTSIGNYAFCGCSGLTSVMTLMETPVSIANYSFWNRENVTLYVPVGCRAAYEAANYWKEFKEILEFVEPSNISQFDNLIYIENMEARCGTQATISLKMKNSAPIRGFQFDLYLPEGVTVAKSAKGKILGQLSPGRLPDEDEHTLTFSEQPDGAIRFLCGSQYDEVFTGNNGEVATLTVNIAETMAEGDYPIQLKNMVLNETDISKFYETDLVRSTLTIVDYEPGDINNDCIVNVLDYIGVANHIHGMTPTGFNLKAADVDENNVIDVRDYTGVANIIHTGSITGNNNATARRKTDMKEPQ